MMNEFPTKETVEYVRSQYPKGTRVQLCSMTDPYSKLKPGDEGFVTHIDDTATIFVCWNNGENLGIVYGVDSCRKI